MRLIACGGRKAPHPTKAKDLYTGGVFKAARAWAEESPDGAWGIVSAKHGILLPDDFVEPYDYTTNSVDKIARAIRYNCDLPAHSVLVVAAPRRYFEAVARELEGAQWAFAELPDTRMGFQMQWLRNNTKGAR